VLSWDPQRFGEVDRGHAQVEDRSLVRRGLTGSPTDSDSPAPTLIASLSAHLDERFPANGDLRL
jgi:hypothetical protein